MGWLVARTVTKTLFFCCRNAGAVCKVLSTLSYLRKASAFPFSFVRTDTLNVVTTWSSMSLKAPLGKFGSCLTRSFKIVVLADRCVSTFSSCDHIIRLSIYVCHRRIFWHLDYSWYCYSLFATLWPSRHEKDEWVRVNSLNWHSLRLWTLLYPFRPKNDQNQFSRNGYNT